MKKTRTKQVPPALLVFHIIFGLVLIFALGVAIYIVFENRVIAFIVGGLLCCWFTMFLSTRYQYVVVPSSVNPIVGRWKADSQSGRSGLVWIFNADGTFEFRTPPNYVDRGTYILISP